MRKLLHIGEIAQLLGVTAKTIRHYQKVGLPLLALASLILLDTAILTGMWHIGQVGMRRLVKVG